jgi:hypothetical protein
MVADKDFVSAVAAKLLCEPRNIVAEQKAGNFFVQLVSKLARFGNKLKVRGHEFARALLAKDPHTVKFIYFCTIVTHS